MGVTGKSIYAIDVAGGYMKLNVCIEVTSCCVKLVVAMEITSCYES